ncbi:MAG: ribose 5-phosphate isomerase A [Candidatus Bathyarchaeota archaeon]|nr:ribose 5-phosphate isomerase A [Candidatus Bathyarchaeota archaeon]
MKANLNPIEAAKKEAAVAAIQHVEDNFVVGLGSGSTAAYAIEALGERIKQENLHVLGIPSSYQAFQLAVQNKISLTTLEEHPEVDVNIDGADQIDPNLELIKGMGAALVREKIVATAAKVNIIIADDKKIVKVLGENNQAVPTEVVPFAIGLVQHKLLEMGVKPVLREVKGKLGPVISDNGNAVMDVNFGAIDDPAKLAQKLKMIPGIVETGLFVGTTDLVYVGTQSQTQKLQRKQ